MGGAIPLLPCMPWLGQGQFLTYIFCMSLTPKCNTTLTEHRLSHCQRLLGQQRDCGPWKGSLTWNMLVTSERFFWNFVSTGLPIGSKDISRGQRVYIRGSFQKFYTLYVFSLKMNLFYKIQLQTFNVISIVLYHRSPTFGQVLYSCLDAFVVDVSDYSGHLIRHLLNASEAKPTRIWLVPKTEETNPWDV
jgi:hypothetical protein